jgi:hypothetical protein
VTGSVLAGSANAKNTIEAILSIAPDPYERATYDLGTSFRNVDYKGYWNVSSRKPGQLQRTLTGRQVSRKY